MVRCPHHPPFPPFHSAPAHPPTPQAHHAAREVFLTHTRDVNDAATLLRHAHVLPAGEFWGAPPELGDDVFLCDYEYDEAWQARRGEGGELGTVRGVPGTCPPLSSF